MIETKIEGGLSSGERRATVLEPPGVGVVQPIDTLLIFHLWSNKKFLDCVEWVETVLGGAGDAERDFGATGAGGRQIPLIRLHVLGGELKED